MILEPPIPVLADAIGTLITTAFIVITLIGWIINYVNSQAKPPAPNRGGRAPRPRSERIQAEIEQFMRDQSGKKPAMAEPARARPVEPVRPTPRRSGRTTQSAKPVRAPAVPQPEADSPLPKPGAAFLDRKHVGTDGLGQSVREHVRSTMTERVQAGASQHLRHEVDASVKEHLGAFTAEGKPRPALTGPPIGLTAMEVLSQLKTTDGVRRAIILNEILLPPPGRRRRGHGLI